MHAAPAELAGAWNFGSSDDSFITVGAMVEQVVQHWGDGEIDSRPDTALHEAQFLKLDSSKARTLLGWRPRWDVRTAVSKTVEWYRRHRAGEDMLAVSQEQIAAYSGQ